MKPIRWGILSTGHIAGVFAQGVAQSKTGSLEGVGSRSFKSAIQFARKHKISKAYENYDALLRDPGIDAVYIATPHPFHAEWTLKAARAGKHILCEKPLAMNFPEARKVIQEVRRCGVFLMEAFLFRCHPQTEKLVELIRKKIIGEVRLIQAAFCFERPLDLKDRLFNRKLGGGAILDVGCYPVAMARLLAGRALGKSFADPLEVKGIAVAGTKSRVDEIALASLKFPGGILAEISCATRVDRGPSMVKVDGSKGILTVPSPWSAKRDGGTSYLLFQRKGDSKYRKIPVHCRRSIYTVEADTVADCLHQDLIEYSAMSWEDSLGNMKTLDLWRKTSGAYY